MATRTWTILTAFMLVTACDCGGSSSTTTATMAGGGGGMNDDAAVAGGGGTVEEDAGPPDPCGEITCNAGQSCTVQDDVGVCVADCDAITCNVGQSCDATGDSATCVADCDGVTCPAGRICVAEGTQAECVVPCEAGCGAGQRCEVSGMTSMCIDNSCAELACALPFVCQPATDGNGGNVCVDISCESDLNCDDDENCSLDSGSGEMICTSDVCTPGATQCTGDGNAVEECLGNGGGFFTRFSCGTAGSCTEDAGGAFCPCEDDWDCPSNTECVVDRCEGTGVAPTCFVPVANMEDVLPQLEFQWGTTDDTSDRTAAGRPFPASTQTVMTPLVANLTDDNGDGLVDERDDPEILFMTFCDSQFRQDGVLRAVHGGGTDAMGNPLQGLDWFASSEVGGNPLVWNRDTATSTDELDGMFSCTDAPLDSTASLAVGNLDGDAAGFPEIVIISEGNAPRIYDSRGHLIAEAGQSVSEGMNGSPSLVNVDGQGLPEIVIGHDVWMLAIDGGGDLVFDRHFDINDAAGDNTQGPISCVADLDGDGRQEIIAGSHVYEFPMEGTQEFTDGDLIRRPRGNERNGFCAIADVWGAIDGEQPGPNNPLDGVPEIIVAHSGRIYVYRSDDSGTELDVIDFPGNDRGGAPNVDDFDGDGFPEIGTAGATGYVMADLQPPVAIDGNGFGCPAWPNTIPLETLTGDQVTDRGPFPPPTIAGNDARVVPTNGDGSAILCSTDADCNPGIDPPAFACNEDTRSCVCLHNEWTRTTEDGSSRVTGSSVFDFNGDGAAEIVYNDECFFRVYSGIDGQLYSRIPSESRTRTEYPIVADVDNDGNAEIVFPASNESGNCNLTTYEDVYNAGLEVWGEPNDLWSSARRIWNQHAYSITNVSESGAIPTVPRDSWDPVLRDARGFNSYRSNPSSRAGIAPDLQVRDIQIVSTAAGCGAIEDEIEIIALIENAGDLRVGATIEVGFSGLWGGVEHLLRDNADNPIRVPLGVTLEPGGSVRVSAIYDAAGKTPAGVPDTVRVTVDPDDLERECDDAGDTDNVAEADVGGGDSLADLRLVIDGVTESCPDARVDFTVFNDGSEPTPGNVVVRFYAGDPDAGGSILGETTVPGPIAPGANVVDQHAVTVPGDRDIVIHAVVDPSDEVIECNDGNNADAADDAVFCEFTPG